MQVRDVMTPSCEFIAPNTSISDAARRMRDLDCGFLAIGTEAKGRLEGVVTDRDLVIRALAEGWNPDDTPVERAETHQVLYCFENDSLEAATKRMREQQIYRLVVLNNQEEKQLRGVISLGDILRRHESDLAEPTAEAIASKAA